MARSGAAGRAKRTTSAAEPSAADRARADILEVATTEFAEYGYSGARVDEIATKTKTSKRMIYYSFGDKEGLFTAVLEEGYRQMRALERELDVDRLDPEGAMRALVGGTFEYQAAHERFVRFEAWKSSDACRANGSASHTSATRRKEWPHTRPGAIHTARATNACSPAKAAPMCAASSRTCPRTSHTPWKYRDRSSPGRPVPKRSPGSP